MLNFNYGGYVFQQLVTTELVQKKLTEILISIAANIINMHLVTILCSIISLNVYIDFFLQIAISVICSLRIHYIYNFLEHYKAEFGELTKYLINNYSIENYLYWKRCIIIGICAYASVALLLVRLTNWVLFLYIFQYAVCFLIIEQFEQQRIQRWVREYKTRPKTTILTDDPTSNFLINSYLSPKSNVLRTQKIIGDNCSGNISSTTIGSDYHQSLTNRANSIRNSVTGNTQRLTRSNWRRNHNQQVPYNTPPTY